MAADLVKGKDKKSKAATSQVTPKKSVRIAESATKRKATEEASPESVKKRKSTEKAAEPEKKKKTEKKPATKKPAAKKDNEEQADEQDEEDDTTKALVQDIDGGDEDQTEGGASLFQPGQDVGKAPVTKAKKATKPKTKKAAATNGASNDDDDETEGGVVYVGRIPHGFFEHEMHAYFSQFGDIRNLRLSRNRKTGASKHYAFIEFADADVAEIVAKTMDHYLLFGHILRCSVVSPDRVPENLFKGANRRFKAVPWNQMAGRKLSLPRPESQWNEKIKGESKRRERRAAKLQEKLGYSFEAPAIKSTDAIEGTPNEDKAEEQQQTDKKEEPVPKAIANGKDKAEEAVLAATTAPVSKAKKAKGKKSAKA